MNEPQDMPRNVPPIFKWLAIRGIVVLVLFIVVIIVIHEISGDEAPQSQAIAIKSTDSCEAFPVKVGTTYALENLATGDYSKNIGALSVHKMSEFSDAFCVTLQSGPTTRNSQNWMEVRVGFVNPVTNEVDWPDTSQEASRVDAGMYYGHASVQLFVPAGRCLAVHAVVNYHEQDRARVMEGVPGTCIE